MNKWILNRCLHIVSTLFLLALGVAVNAASLPLADKKALLEEARNGDLISIPVSVTQKPIYPYLRYYQLKSSLPEVAPQEVRLFVEEYADTPLAAWMINSAIGSYAKSSQWQDVLAVTNTVPNNIEANCRYQHALWKAENKISWGDANKLWLSGHSRPSACDAYFKQLKQVGYINKEQLWARLLLALEARQAAVASYLLKELDKTDWSTRSTLVRTLLGAPEELLNKENFNGLGNAQTNKLLYALSLRLTQTHTDQSLQQWPKVQALYQLSSKQKERVERSFAAFSYKLDPDNATSQKVYRSILEQYAEAKLIEPALRQAIADSNWADVIHWTEKVTDEEYYSAYNQYWRGRALKQLGLEQQADQAFRLAASKRNFYGFLAADYLSLPYQLNQSQPEVASEQLVTLGAEPSIQRIASLISIQEYRLALAEWNHYLAKHTDQTAVLAEYAKQQNWYGLSVASTIKGRHWDYVDHRFPLAYRVEFMNWSKVREVDANLLMAIARRESAFNPEAVSPVGALGLMQMMPATSRYVSRNLEIEAPDRDGLFEKDTNIELASAYVKELLDQFNGSLILALAGYNAGPNKATQWASEGPLEFDQFIESIPYGETRKYVKAVLAYRVIFNLMTRQDDILVLRPEERMYPAAFARSGLFEESKSDKICQVNATLC